MLNFLKNSFFINPNKKILNNYKLLLDNVNNLESQTKSLSDLQIKNKTNDLKQAFSNGKKLDDNQLVRLQEENPDAYYEAVNDEMLNIADMHYS